MAVAQLRHCPVLRILLNMTYVNFKIKMRRNVASVLNLIKSLNRGNVVYPGIDFQLTNLNNIPLTTYCRNWGDSVSKRMNLW